jgi:hypothetical protein
MRTFQLLHGSKIGSVWQCEQSAPGALWRSPTGWQYVHPDGSMEPFDWSRHDNQYMPSIWTEIGAVPPDAADPVPHLVWLLSRPQ